MNKTFLSLSLTISVFVLSVVQASSAPLPNVYPGFGKAMEMQRAADEEQKQISHDGYQSWAEEKVKAIRFFKYPGQDLCFAYYWNGGHAAITAVDCNKIPGNKLIVLDYDRSHG